jgi:hypothetical protein
MTAIAAVKEDACITFAVDTAHVGRDGKVASFGGKLRVLDFPRSIKGVVVGTGIGGFPDAFGEAVAGAYESFDAIVDDFEVIAKAAFERAAKRWCSFYGDSWAPNSTLVIGGWSHRNAVCELYNIHSHPRKVCDGATRQITCTKPAWAKTLIDELYCSGVPCRTSLERVGVAVLPERITAIELTVRFACAMRQECDNPDLPEGPFGVGGHIDVTQFYRDGIARWVAHRWPDEEGKPTDPTCGDILPATFEPTDVKTIQGDERGIYALSV